MRTHTMLQILDCQNPRERHRQRQQTPAQTAEGVPKIALLFLVTRQVLHEELWGQWLNLAGGLKVGEGCPMPSSDIDLEKSYGTEHALIDRKDRLGILDGKPVPGSGLLSRMVSSDVTDNNSFTAHDLDSSQGSQASSDAKEWLEGKRGPVGASEILSEFANIAFQ